MHQGSSVEAIKTAGVGDGMIDAATAKQTEGMGAVLGFVDRYRKVLLGLVLVIYLAGFNGVWRPEPDSALYMTIGRNLAEGKGYTYLGKVDGLAYPGFPYFLAGVFKVFGAGSLFVPHLLVWLMGLATLGLTYAYFRQHESRAMAVLVTVNCGVAQTLYLCALQLRNDVPFLMGVMGFLTGYEAILRRSRRKEVRVGDLGASVWGLRNSVTPWVLLCAGLVVAITMRPTMLALVGAIVLAGIWSVSRGSVRMRYGVAVLAVVVAGVVVFYALDPRGGGVKTGGQYEQIALAWMESPGKFVARLFSPRTIELFSRSTMEAMFGHELGLGVNTVVTVGMLGVGLWIVRKRPLWFFYLSATIVMMLVMAEMDQPFGGEAGQLVPRHFVGALPLLVYLWWRCAGWVEKRLGGRFSSGDDSEREKERPGRGAAKLGDSAWGRYMRGKWGMLAVGVMTVVAFGPNLVKVCETIARQRVYAYETGRGRSETNSVERMGKAIALNVKVEGTVVVPHKRGRQFAFYSGMRVIEATPVLRYRGLAKPVYVVEESEGSVALFMKKQKLEMGPALATEPGGLDWRGREQKEWGLHEVGRKNWQEEKKTSNIQH